ncbi:MAG: VOC family protein [Betaproteobacteria bacterium]|jgi:catechol 2,3-dioxygenase-like lactoylglutathione lyase family enzyme|nr:VOC family protein [Betaproteobacteria bacterium]
MFSILGLDHVVLRVTSLARMQRFYCEVLGCTLERERPDLGMVQLRAGNALIDLVDVAGDIGRKGGVAPGREGRNMDHLCLRIEPFDPGAISAQLLRHGVVPGEIKLRYGADGQGPSLYLSDPEGNVVELKGPPSRS